MRKPARVGARHEEAREPVRRLREHEERIRHRRRAEPLLPVERRTRRRRPAARAVVFARTSEPPCRSVIAIPQSAPSPRRSWSDVSARLPLGRERRARRGAPARPRSHGQRTAGALLHLRPVTNIAARATCAPGTRLAPRQCVQAGLDAELQQRVPRRVELDLVDRGCRSGRACAAPADARSPAAPTRAARRREHAPSASACSLAVAAALALERLDERQVLGEEVVVDERRGLIHGAHCRARRRRRATRSAAVTLGACAASSSQRWSPPC